MSNNNIYSLIVDADLDLKLKEFKRQLKEGEEIVAQSTVEMPDGRTRLVITTKESPKGKRNLLLEELRERQ
jgi:hypothetical protein